MPNLAHRYAMIVLPMDPFSVRPTRVLPVDYTLRKRFNARDPRTLLSMNAASLATLFLFGWFFFAVSLWLRPTDTTAVLSTNWGGLPPLAAIAVILLLFLVVIYLHEAVHGLGFWLATHTRPVFGFRTLYAFAGAPEWYLPRDVHLWIGLAPLLGISGLGIFLLALAPAQFIAPILLAMIMNASGAVGDLWVVWLELRQPADALVCDSGEEVRIYSRR